MGVHNFDTLVRQNTSSIEEEEDFIDEGIPTREIEEQNYINKPYFNGTGSCGQSNGVMRSSVVVATCLICVIILCASYIIGSGRSMLTQPATESQEMQKQPLQIGSSVIQGLAGHKNENPMLPQRQCIYAKTAECPAWDVILDPQIHQVSSDILMRIGSGFFHPKDRSMVEGIVEDEYKNICIGLHENHPAIAAALKSIQISKLQKDEMLHLMELMYEPRLQSLGLDVAKALNEIGDLFTDSPANKKKVQYQIEKKLFPRREEIWKLSNELIPTMVHDFFGEKDQWSMTLRPDNIRSMQTMSDKWVHLIGEPLEIFQDDLQVNAHAMAPGFKDTSLKNFGVFGGVLEESRILLTMIEIRAHVLGLDLKMPRLAVQHDGSTDLVAESVVCDLKGEPVHWFLQAVVCPLMFGAQGIDALRAASSIMNSSRTVDV